MKTTRETIVGIVALAVVAALALAYSTAVGRRVVRGAMRGARDVSNVGGDSRPAMVLRIWGNTPEASIRVEVYTSGRLVASRPDRAVVSLDGEATEKILAAAQLALGDFNATGCDTSQGGTNADLSLLVRGRKHASLCRDARDWPQGPNTRRLLKEISARLPADMVLPVNF
jgi:hypothetical protein